MRRGTAVVGAVPDPWVPRGGADAPATTMRHRSRDLEPQGDHGPHTLRVFDGVVVGAFGDDVFVELGPRMQGVISRRVFAAPPAIGDRHQFTLRGQEEGLWALSLREQKSLATWEQMEQGSLVHARVIRLGTGGLELKIGPLHAFMPRSHTGLDRREDLSPLVGKTLVCEVIEVDRERQRVLVSRKVVERRERESERQRRVGTLEPGKVVHGRVTRIEPYGVFVALGQDLEGLVHVSNLAHERPAHPSELVREGDVLELKVLHVKEGGKRIALGAKQLERSPWSSIDPERLAGAIVEGRVKRVLEWGAFVSIARGVEGLLRAADAGLAPGEPVSARLAAGDRVSVRVVAVDPANERLALSLLHTDGRRLAPDEAENARSFAELARDGGGGPLGTALGGILREALRRPKAG